MTKEADCAFFKETTKKLARRAVYWARVMFFCVAIVYLFFGFYVTQMAVLDLVFGGPVCCPPSILIKYSLCPEGVTVKNVLGWEVFWVSGGVLLAVSATGGRRYFRGFAYCVANRFRRKV